MHLTMFEHIFWLPYRTEKICFYNWLPLSEIIFSVRTFSRYHLE